MLTGWHNGTTIIVVSSVAVLNIQQVAYTTTILLGEFDIYLSFIFALSYFFLRMFAQLRVADTSTILLKTMTLKTIVVALCQPVSAYFREYNSTRGIS